jgi:hypothetical protein
MAEAFYEVLEESDAQAPTTALLARATQHTGGPWGPGLQHGGPPAALLARAVRRLAGAPAAGLPARMAFDILAPVPVADLVVTARMLRPGRRVALAEANLAAADAPDRPLMALRAWLLRRAGAPLPGVPEVGAADPPPPAAGPAVPSPPGWHGGYLDAVEWRLVAGSFDTPGPATVWTRLRVDLVDTEPLDPLGHLVAVSDAASGISAVASPQALLFVNTDLTLHLTRLPEGDSIWMRAETTLDPRGTGRALGALGDADGQVAASAQCLFVEPRG